MAVGEIAGGLADVCRMPEFGCRLAKLPYDSWFGKVKASTPFAGGGLYLVKPQFSPRIAFLCYTCSMKGFGGNGEGQCP